MPSASRRRARIAALQTLYEIDSTHHPVAEVLQRNLEEPISESASVIESLGEDARAFATALVEGVLAHQAELDEIIVRSAPNWPIDQMSRIDKGILRLAIFEILFDNKVPLKAAINEAVELGKRFGSDSSSRFINGVLGTVADMRSQLGPRQQSSTKEKGRRQEASQTGETEETTE